MGRVFGRRESISALNPLSGSPAGAEREARACTVAQEPRTWRLRLLRLENLCNSRRLVHDFELTALAGTQLHSSLCEF